MANILIFGDSITLGLWDEKGGWAQRLKHDIDNKIISSNFTLDHFVYSLGVPGDTSHTLLQRFKQETDARIVPQEETIFLFAIGINDCIYNNKTHSHMTPLWKFTDNIHILIQSAKKYTQHIFFVGLTPVDESKVDPMSWHPDNSYRNEFIRQYDWEIQKMCLQERVEFIDTFSKWNNIDYKALLTDGVHPNTEGHTVLYELVGKNIEQIIFDKDS